MIKFIRLAVKEISNGENLDLYIMILISVVVALLGILQVASYEIISGTTLAILALLASALLLNRKANFETKATLSQVRESLGEIQRHVNKQSYISDVLIKSYPDLSNKLREAKSVSILGSTLSSTVLRYYSEFANILKRNGDVRFLVCECTPEVMAMHTFRSASSKDSKVIAGTVENNIAIIKTINNEVMNISGTLEVRIIPYLSSYNLIIIDNDDRSSRAYVKLIGFGTPDSEQPTFEVDSQYDHAWFQFFRSQYESLWSVAKTI